MSSIDPQYIIAIGASAGGMEEINTFFDHTPLDGVSYVVVQHLSPDFKSRMAEVIGRHSKLVVKEAENGMMIQGNQVYTIPSNMFMTIRESRLYLADKEKTQGPHLTINRFFNSLATDMGPKAIVVILSGLGSDGSEGIRNIKKEGGMIIARTPETSEFSSMPSSAIATGLVDFVLEPEVMPDTIEDYIKHGAEFLLENKDDEKNLTTIIDIINQQLPLDFSEYKQSTILRRIKRRAAFNQLNKLPDYIEFLKVNPQEIEALANDFLISVTSFFRDKKAFKYLQTNVLPAILKNLTPGEEIKIWVAGCATGEEAYSLAMLMCDLLEGKYKDTVVKIFATDVDSHALQQASKGIYNESIAKDVSEEQLQKYFSKEGDGYRVLPILRSMMIFAKHDLVKNPPYCNMHLISCRNLLIYMTPPLQKKILLMLLFGLKVEGYLFLGSSENPTPIIENLEVVNNRLKVYKNFQSKPLVRFDAFSLPELKPKYSITAREESTTSHTITEAANELLVMELGYLAICIDENNHVVKTYGDTTKFLLQKNFNLNFTELLPRPLAVAFNTLSINALKSHKKATVNGIKIKIGEFAHKVNMSVNHLKINKGSQKLLLVIISDQKSENLTTQEGLVFDEKLYHDKYTLNLEEEIKELKDKLHSMAMQLDISNENMQSFNEELLSSNEEMQSTNEEMQSINEELHTINADYQLKNKELLELNDDLNNYFRSNINGQLFVNKDLQLMKFSPGTVKQINLLPTDVGRPLNHITTNFKFETIIDDIKKVITDGEVVTKEIQTENGKWYQVRTMPYIQIANNTPNGAIITFNDITFLKKVQTELDTKNESLMRINADLDNFVHTASHDLLAPLGNIEISISMMNEMGNIDPKLKTFLSVINASSKKFRSLITDISTVAKLESGMLEMEMVDINEILDNIEWSLESKIKSSGATINRDIEVTNLMYAKKNLRSILYNLISNGIKFKTDCCPVINIKTSKHKDQVVIAVQDNGIGISKVDMDKIFEMYGRLHHDIEGHGIGLYLAQKIVHASGGNIVVESEPGKGSTFKIFLPANQENAKVAASLN